VATRSVHDPKQVSSSPTLPAAAAARRAFDVRDLYRGPASESAAGVAPGAALDEKCRQAYFWIVNHAIITPYYDIEFNDGAAPVYRFGGAGTEVRLPTGQSYSSFVLLPMLNFATRKRCLFIGGPGRGKTASAILMGVLAGYPLAEVRRGIQHGQPQMTIADLLGNPLSRCGSRSSTSTTGSRRARSRRCSRCSPMAMPRSWIRRWRAPRAPGTSRPTTTSAAAPIR
jgi:hypothetical protein